MFSLSLSRWGQAVALSFMPWWMRLAVVPVLHSLGLLKDRGIARTSLTNMWRDIQVVRAIPRKYFDIVWSVVGFPQDEVSGGLLEHIKNWGSAPDSEIKISLRLLFLEVPFLVVMDFVGFWFVVISCIPVVCALYPLYTWLLTVDSTKRVCHDESALHQDKNERWFFVNGIMNSRTNAHKNVLRLSKLFNRPITLIYNPTQGMLMDLIECLLARTFQLPTFPALSAHKLIEAAILDKSITRVVVVGHSQGCLISAEVLKYLDGDFRGKVVSDHKDVKIESGHLEKLEVYLFASPAAEVTTCDGRVHVEHFANRSDLVALSGVINPKREELQPKAADPRWVFVRNRNGHILNESYLRDFDYEEFPYTPLVNGNTNKSRLEDRVHKLEADIVSSSSSISSHANVEEEKSSGEEEVDTIAIPSFAALPIETFASPELDLYELELTEPLLRPKADMPELPKRLEVPEPSKTLEIVKRSEPPQSLEVWDSSEPPRTETPELPSAVDESKSSEALEAPETSESSESSDSSATETSSSSPSKLTASLSRSSEEELLPLVSEKDNKKNKNRNKKNNNRNKKRMMASVAPKAYV